MRLGYPDIVTLNICVYKSVARNGHRTSMIVIAANILFVSLLSIIFDIFDLIDGFKILDMLPKTIRP